MESLTFAQQLVAARKAAGLTQAQLADMMHMSRQGVSHWETGRALPDAEMLKQLSQALNYDFLTSGVLQQLEEASAAQPEAPGGTLPWRTLALCLGALVIVLSVALAALALRGSSPAASRQVQGTAAPGAVAVGDRAEVRIIPAQNPLVPSYDPVLGPAPWWIFHLTLQETAGVDFTIEKMTYTYQYRNGERNVVEYGAEFIAAGNPLGTNVLRSGMNLNFSGAEPLRDFASISVRVDGTDARGNVLAFECVMDCQTPEPTATPVVDASARGVLKVQAVPEVAYPQVLEDLGPDPVWFVCFDVYESAGVPVTLEGAVLTAHAAEGVAWQETYDAQQIRDIFGFNVLSGTALPWTVCNGLSPLTGFTLQVEATDANGNALTAGGHVILRME